MRELLRTPTMVVFLLGLLGAVIAWGIRQELLNVEQTYALKALTHRVDQLERRDERGH